MEFHIENAPVFTTLRIAFQAGETFKAESGAMVSMSPGITLESKSSGKGIFGTLKAAVGGVAFCVAFHSPRSRRAHPGPSRPWRYRARSA